MMGARRGFTIIEVMIVLSISAFMLVSASAIFGSRRQATQFSQAVYDLQSKFQSWANNVSSASVPGLQSYSCTVSATTRPVLDNTSGGVTGKDCIYLGQAIQVVSAGGSTIYSYPVFGLRSVHTGGSDSCATSCVFPTSPDEANPEPAINATGSFVLVDSYELLNGLTVTTAKTSTTGNENDLLTLYSSLRNSSNTSGNEVSVASYEKTFTSQDTATLKSCIEAPTAAAPGCGNPTKTAYINNTSWTLCVTDGPRKAQLSLNGTATGLTTRLDMNGSSCS